MIRNKTKMPLSPFLYNIMLEAHVHSINPEKEIRGIQIGKKIENYPHSQMMIIYVENFKDSTKDIPRTKKPL